ncbi:phage tail protein [Aurantimonas sp. MSK8Z-1]|uniref:phage tail protein n=1 Tax=Mangrovibrevibacter kandeliae TaxID=2968473 RepID=UPI0021193181|nr:phage tail protein [Aurantimonas sp. MSK8Z-1]MCW4114755.1 phage tail protein [Aurantimonas sp. MSK8Z-1]
MSDLSLVLDGDGLERFGNLVGALSGVELAQVKARALNHTGAKARTQVKRALARQTGLKPAIVQRALKVRRATGGRLAYVITGRGGEIALRFFGPRETRKGVSAAPFGERRVFDGTFLKGGLFPNRRELRLGGQVFEPDRSVKAWGRPATVVKSGVVIPAEMVKGETASAFQSMAPALGERLAHEIGRSQDLRDLTGGSIF